MSVDETVEAEREGKRSSTGHMNVAGWARESAPWRLYKWRLQCCAHGTVPHVPAPTVAISTLKAPFAPTPPKRVFFSGRSQRPSLLPKRQQIVWPAVLFTASFFSTRRSFLRLFLSGRSLRPSFFATAATHLSLPLLFGSRLLCWVPSLLSPVRARETLPPLSPGLSAQPWLRPPHRKTRRTSFKRRNRTSRIWHEGDLLARHRRILSFPA